MMNNLRPNSSAPHTRDSDPDLEAAELEVKRAEAAFSAKLQDASEVGRDAALRVAHAAKPVLIGAAVVASLGLVVLAVRSARRPSPWGLKLQPPRRSVFSEMMRAALVSLAGTVARHAGENFLAKHANAQPTLGQSAPALSPPITSASHARS